MIAPCPEPCGLWDCAFHAHLGLRGPIGCATEEGVEYRQMLIEAERHAMVMARLTKLEDDLRMVAAEIGVLVMKPGKA